MLLVWPKKKEKRKRKRERKEGRKVDLWARMGELECREKVIGN